MIHPAPAKLGGTIQLRNSSALLSAGIRGKLEQTVLRLILQGTPALGSAPRTHQNVPTPACTGMDRRPSGGGRCISGCSWRGRGLPGGWGGGGGNFPTSPTGPEPLGRGSGRRLLRTCLVGPTVCPMLLLIIMITDP